MPDRYLLESGAPDGYQLEDGSGVLLINGESYSAAVLSDNPISYWRLSDASGLIARDVQNVNPGIFVGGPTLGAAGLLNSDSDETSVTFNGTTQRVRIPTGQGGAPAGSESCVVHGRPCLRSVDSERAGRVIEPRKRLLWAPTPSK
jgi:hypothetical protein